MLNISVRVLVVQLLLLGTRSVGQQIDIQHLYGSWRVSDVLCADCGNRVPAEKGTTIQLGESKIVNPLSDNCAEAPGYNLLKKITARELLTGAGKSWPEAAKQRLQKRQKVLYGFVTCGGGNYMQVAFLSVDEGFYFFEGNLVFLLRHTHTAAQKRQSN
ncbi:MAG: hypothetical protein ABSA27_15925 [Terriglobales bacterium]|jgi:hypothetical protein